MVAERKAPRSNKSSKSNSQKPKLAPPPVQPVPMNSGAGNAANNYYPAANLQGHGNVAGGSGGGGTAAYMNNPNGAPYAANGGGNGGNGGAPPQQQAVNNAAGGDLQSWQNLQNTADPYTTTYNDSFMYYGDFGRLDTLVGYGSHGKSNRPNNGYPHGSSGGQPPARRGN